MKNLFIFLISIFFLYACNSDYQNGSNSNNLLNINSSIDTSNYVSIEKLLRVQLKIYLKSIFADDMDKALSYCYADMFVWLKQTYPDSYSIDFLKELTRTPFQKLKDLSIKEKISFIFEIGDISKKIDLGNDKIFVINVCISGIYKINKITKCDEILAITIDNGLNWKFVEKNPETTPGILGIRFSEDIIQKVLN